VNKEYFLEVKAKVPTNNKIPPFIGDI